MSLYKRIDDYFLKAREPDDPPTRRQDARAHVREPAKIVFALGKNTWLLATCSWTNVLLPLIPVALAVSARNANGATEFWVNYIDPGEHKKHKSQAQKDSDEVMKALKASGLL